jgi:digeranylgeranylglycerophospholipid reductase
VRYFDVIIIGAGFAGIECAKMLALSGLSVALLERKKDVGEGIHTTGIFVHETENLIEIPDAYHRKINQVRLYSPSLYFREVRSSRYMFAVTDTPSLMRHFLEETKKAGVEVYTDCPFSSARPTERGLCVNERFECRLLVGADGAKSRVAEHFGLGRNRRFLLGVEAEYDGITLENPDAFYCFLSRRYASGYIGWVIPGPRVLQVGVACTEDKKPDIGAFFNFIEPVLVKSAPRIVERRGGRIPIGGLVQPFYNDHVILVGDAAGIVSPLTAGGIHTALYYGKRLGALTAQHLKANGPHPGTVLTREYPHFLLKHGYRKIFERIPDWAFDAMLRAPGFNHLANAMFFLKKRLPKNRK